MKARTMIPRLAGLILAMLVLTDGYSRPDVPTNAALEFADTTEMPRALQGLDLDGIDPETEPGADFYRFANGRWQDAALIESGNWQTGTSQTVRDLVEDRAQDIVRSLRRSRWPSGSNESKFLTIYNNYNNRDARQQAGLRPIRPFLDLIARAETHNDVASLLGSYNLDAGGLLKVSLRLDPIEGAGYVASIEAADLLLGSQALYLRSDSLAVDQKARAQRLLIRLLKRSSRLSRAEDRVAAVLDLEHRLADLYPDPVTARRPVSPEHVFDIVGLETQFPDFPWRRFLAARGVTQDVELQAPINGQLGDLISLFNTIPVQVWRDYMSLRLILSYGNYLDDTTDRLVARFDAASIGVEYQASRRRERAWRVAVDLLPDPVGQAYVDQYLDDQTIADVHRIVDWTIVAFRERIQTAEWLTDQTRSRALEKLNAITVVVGRPLGWNNFEFFTPIRGSLFANAYSRQQLRHRSALARLVSSTGDAEEEGTGSDNRLKDIFFSPLSVGAYYLPTLNTIIVPAAYLQAPYYDSSASAAVNFGALGTTIGHELGHAFDDQGARRGPDGQIADWWEDADQAQFTIKGERLSRHLSTYNAAPGIALNTGLTLGENLSDLVGVEIAYRAFELERTVATGAPITQVDAQSFFISYAQKRRAKRLTTAAIDLALSNTHSPPEVRVNGILPHIDSWYSAFDIDDTNALWLSPEERVRVW